MSRTTATGTGLLLALMTLVSACGLAETGAATATGARSAAEQAGEARKTEDEVRKRLDDAARQDAARRAAGEEDGR
ncbi:MAG: hypothetical protein JOZ89_03905 [Gammaproteobacteria bacterium]|nr:hypothetical protein [Gammaproteobacteria bacterium]